MSAPDATTPPDPYRLAALAVLERAGVPLVGFFPKDVREENGHMGVVLEVAFRADLSAAADQMRAELEAAEARGEARAVGRVAT
jgi:thiol:disulfide interchange protein